MPRFSGTLVEDAPASEPVRRPRFSGTLVEDMPQDSGGGSNGYKMARGAYMGALDGASLSFGDELGAGLGAASEYLNSLLPESDVLGTGKSGRSYAEIRDQIRAQNRQAQEDAPGSYFAGQLAGGIASSAPIAGAGLVGGAARSTAARLAIASGTGAGAGAVQGFGAGEGGLNERFKEVGKGMVIGGGLGFLSVPAGAAVGRGLNYAGDFLASRGGPVGRSGQDLLQRTLADEGLTLEDAARRAREIGPSAMLSDASEGLRYRAEQIAQSDNPARSGVIGALKDRSAAAGGRINTAYDDVLGPRPNVHDTLEGMLNQRSTASQPLYEKALSRPVAWDNRLQAFLGDPITQSGLARGVKIQRLESLADDVPFNPQDYAIVDFNPAGDPIIGGVPNMRTLNVVKKGLDAIVDDNRNEFGRLTEMGRAVDKVRSSFLSKLDSINPEYAAARQEWGGRSEALKAFQKGQELFQSKTHPDFLAADVAKMSKADREAMQLGARSAVDEAMGRVRNGSLKGRQLLDSDFNERKILTVLGGDDGRTLINSLQGEQAMAETAHQAIGNSATSRRMDNPFRVQQRTAQDRAVPGILRSAGNLNFGDAAFRGLEYAQDALGRRTASTMAGELGPALTATGDARERIVQELLARGAQREEARAIDPKIRGVTEALIRGGALAYGQNALR